MAAFGHLISDLRYGLRQLRQAPGFTTVAVLSLALGIGANTAMFQLVEAVRLRTLPVDKPEELAYVDFAQGSQRSGWFSTRSARLTYALWDEIRRQQQAFTGVLAWSATRFNLSPGGEARNVEGLYVSGEFFRHLGVQPLLGRTFAAADDTPACGSPGAVVSYSFWQRELGGDPAAVGRTVTLDGLSFPIIGVTPPAFFGVEVGRSYDVAIPICADPLLSADKKGRIPSRTAWWLSVIGRVRPGWTIERANASMQAISPGIMEATLPPTYRPDQAKRFLVNKLNATAGGTGVSGLRRQYEQPLWLLLAITALVLLIACANLANLLLARGTIREREFAVRMAIGASRGRIVRQLLAESLLLAFAGAVAGAALAQVLSRGLVAFLTSPNEPLFVGLGINGTVLAFTMALGVATCLLFGLVPALRSTHHSPVTAMRAGGRGTTAGRERFSIRRALVVSQVALSLVLLFGALLFVRSLYNLLSVDAGFRAENLMTVSVDMRRPNYPEKQLPVVNREILERLSNRPGVISAAHVAITPVSGSSWNSNVKPEGTGAAESGKESNFNRVGPGYFKTMATRMLAGRDFDERDVLTGPKVAVVNEAFAQRFFGGANPVGRSFRVEAEAGKPEPLYQIVGFVQNTKYHNLREDFVPIAYFPMSQDERPGSNATFILRTAGPLAEAMQHARSAVAEVSPSLGLEFRILPAEIQRSLTRERLMATLSGGFGLLAGLLATLGLYGVISYMVTQRKNEIGVRVALGADRGRVIRLVLREAIVLLVAGLAVGALAAVWAGRTAATLLFGLKPHDPVTLLSAMAVLAAVALAAAYGPALRAASLQPMTALREE